MIEIYAVDKAGGTLSGSAGTEEYANLLINTLKKSGNFRLFKVLTPAGLTVHTLLGIGTWDIFEYPGATHI